MALTFDKSLVPKSDQDLENLAKAVFNAGSADESYWIEWKSTLDLGNQVGVFPVAKAILGFANRQLAEAERACDGHGYLLVGVQPNSVSGIRPIDRANLKPQLDGLVGHHDGPRYEIHYVQFQGKDLLVVDVSPPYFGSPIFALRKSYEKYQKGTIYVRREGYTEPADFATIQLLVERSNPRNAGAFRNITTIESDVPLRAVDVDAFQREFEVWLLSKRAEMLNQVSISDTSPKSQSKSDGEVTKSRATGIAALDDSVGVVAKWQSQNDQIRRTINSALLPTFWRDPRTTQDYAREVDRWVSTARSTSRGVLIGQLAKARMGVVRIRVENSSHTFQPGVIVNFALSGLNLEIELDLPGTIRFSEMPEKFGTKSPFYQGVPSLGSLIPPRLNVKPVGNARKVNTFDGEK